ncbi:MAG: cell envelope integrity protein CreD, partial [Altererythrobacter sp.]|nr:cell envelope integrity protein CreD [Altererythrobacter sp.]
MKLLIIALIGGALIIPLLFVYGLVSDRQHQARVAQDSIAAGWAGAQAVSGPVLLLPYMKDHITTEIVEGRSVRRTVRERHNLFLSPEQQNVQAQIDPQVKERAIYRSVLYRASINGSGRFDLPDDLSGLGIDRQDLLLDEAELRFGMSDPRGLQTDARLIVNGDALELHPGRGPASSGGTGVHAMLDWTSGETLELQWSYSLRGSRSFGFVPRGQSTEWTVTSSWAHPSFVGSFLPDAD